MYNFRTGTYLGRLENVFKHVWSKIKNIGKGDKVKIGQKSWTSFMNVLIAIMQNCMTTLQ